MDIIIHGTGIITRDMVITAVGTGADMIDGMIVVIIGTIAGTDETVINSPAK